MSAEALGKRMGVTKRAVQQIEEGERQGTVALGTLRRAADAMDCDVVHLLVPRESLEGFLDRSARMAIAGWVRNTVSTMALEAQDVSAFDVEETLVEMRSDPARVWRILRDSKEYRVPS